MTAAMTMPGNTAETFPVHFFGNRALGLDRNARTAFPARCLRAGADGMNGSTLH